MPAVPLLDGPLSLTRATSRVDKIAEMAEVLARYGAYANEAASIRLLSGNGFGHGDIVALGDAACRVAAKIVQDRVATEMAKP